MVVDLITMYFYKFVWKVTQNCDLIAKMTRPGGHLDSVEFITLLQFRQMLRENMMIEPIVQVIREMRFVFNSIWVFD